MGLINEGGRRVAAGGGHGWGRAHLSVSCGGSTLTGSRLRVSGTLGWVAWREGNARKWRDDGFRLPRLITASLIM
jgi:hypothetical protein